MLTVAIRITIVIYNNEFQKLSCIRWLRMLLHESLNLSPCLRKRSMSLERLSNPRREQPFIGVPGVPLICQDDDPIILAVPNDPPNRLIDCSQGLLLVPLLSSESMILILSSTTVIFHQICFSLDLLVQIVLLHQYIRVVDLRVRDADHDDTPRCIIRKIDPFAQFPTAYGHENSTRAFLDLILIPCKVLLEHLCLTRLDKHFFHRRHGLYDR